MNTATIDKNMLKAVLVELLAERNAELNGVFEELLIKLLATNQYPMSKLPTNMVEIRKKYALQRQAFAPLHQLFKEAPPASELVKKLRK